MGPIASLIHSLTLLAFAFSPAAPGVLAQTTASPSETREEPAPRGVKEFVPGLRIDWTKRRIEIDSRVVFRKGPLELLACSPKTREHESILVVRPKPLHIYQALGLLGLTPGSPIGYDEANDRYLPPTGEQVQITLRYRDDKGEHEVPAANWLRTTKEKKVPANMTWVFAGSRKLPDGRFVADLDGTVICVVDFDSALIAVGELHSADNELLWLEANTEAIPPIDSPVTIIISPAKLPPQEKPANPQDQKPANPAVHPNSGGMGKR